MTKTTPIKLHEDISGDCVTIDFNSLVSTALTAVGYAKQAVIHDYNEIDNCLYDHNYSKATNRTESLKRDVNFMVEAIHTLHSLTALQETGNRREMLYLYGLSQNVEKLESTYKEGIK